METAPGLLYPQNMSSHCLGELAQARQRASKQTARMTEPAKPVLWSCFVYQIGLTIESSSAIVILFLKRVSFI